MHRRLFVVVFVLASSSVARAGDWTHWRGPAQSGYAADTDLPDKFGLDPADPSSNLVWKQPYGCRSTPIVMRGKVYIINSEGTGVSEGERVMAFDAATGKVAWEYKFPVFHCDIVSSRVGWANLAGDPQTGNVYGHGAQGFFFCLDGKTGKVLWQHSLTEEYGRVTGYGGRIVSPTVVGDLVVVGLINASWGDQGRGANRFVAFDKKTGVVRWWSSPVEEMKGTYYSNPVVAHIGSEQLLITGASDGSVVALQANTGIKAWSYQFGGNVINTSPVVENDLVFIGHGEENRDVAQQGRIICVNAAEIENNKPKLVWEEIGVKAGLASMAVHDGKLYVPDDGATMHCYEAATGKKLWKHKYGRLSRGAPVIADDKIYVADVNAKFHILKPSDTGCKVLHSQPFFSTDGSMVETNGTPAIANGRIYFATRDEIYCVGKPGRKPAGASQPLTMIGSAFLGGAGAPDAAAIFPADVVLKPGESVDFKVRLYDVDGVFIREEKNVEWLLPTPPKTPAGLQPPPLRAEIKDGKLTMSKEVPGQQGYVDAKFGRLTARARVRVAPQLPYNLDLAKVPLLATPGGWVNCQGKYVVVEKDGRRLLKKNADNPAPPVARCNAYITMPDATGYTIQADVMGTYVNLNLPDHGIINERYTMQLAGNKQQLRITSWEALPRLDKTIEFPWKADAWYSMKLTVEQNDGKAWIRGKVWPQGQAEPSAWTIEIEDPRPNGNGSPAIYAYATGILPDKPGAESFFDNIKVTPNK